MTDNTATYSIKLFHKDNSTSLEIIEQNYLNGDNFYYSRYDRDFLF